MADSQLSSQLGLLKRNERLESDNGDISFTVNVGCSEGNLAHETEFHKELFIEEVRKYRCLWDLTSADYKDRNMKNNAWINIGVVFRKDSKWII